MYPESPLQQLIPERLADALRRLPGMVWKPTGLPVNVTATVPDRQVTDWGAARRMAYGPVAERPHFWGKGFDCRWWKLKLPLRTSGGPLWLRWMDQAEATLHLEGVPYFGFDPGHQECLLPQGMPRELFIQSICCRTGIWVPGDNPPLDAAGSRFDGVEVLQRDEGAWQAWNDLQVLMDLLREEFFLYHPTAREFPHFTGPRPPCDRVSPLFRKLLGRVEQALHALDKEGPAALHRELGPVFEEFPASPDQIEAILTGHAHLDLVWMWPERIGEVKAVHSFANVLRLMDRYPEFRFGYSQPASYEAVARRAPRLLDEVRARVAEERWEATGMLYVESDTQLPCGEALARSFVLGQEGYRQLRADGSPSEVLWLPDVFGYSGCLPQLIRAAGGKSFFTTKISWNTISRFPYNSFVWRGFDGSTVVAHVGVHKDYNGTATVGELREAALQQRQAAVHPEVLIPTGYGDGGGGPSDEMCERVRRLRSLAGLPRTQWGGIEPFFARLRARERELPVYAGELYLEGHRGVQTTHGDLKDAFRAAERGLQTWEAVRCATAGGPLPEQPWKRLVFAQFHDHIPGSSIHEVYAEGLPELRAVARDARAAAAQELGAKGGANALFNPLAVEREVMHGGERVRLEPLSGTPVADLRRVRFEPVRAARRTLSNGRLRAEFTTSGEIAALVIDGTPLALTGPANAFHVLPDHPSQFPAWNVERWNWANPYAVSPKARLLHARVGEDGVGEVAFERALPETSRAIVRYRLEPRAATLGIVYEIDWQECGRLLKVAFPTAYRGREARYGAPFGSTLRPQMPGKAADEAQFENPASRWAAVGDDTWDDGLQLVTEAKYGFGAQSGLLHLSLLRSALITPEPNPRSLHRCPDSPSHSDIGRHLIRAAIGRHRADSPRHEQPAVLADTLFTPPVPYAGPACSTPFHGLEGGESLHVAWAKPAAGGLVLRLNETLGRRGRACLRLAPGWQATAVDLLDRPSGGPSIGPGGELSFAPYALISLHLTRKEGSVHPH